MLNKNTMKKNPRNFGIDWLLNGGIMLPRAVVERQINQADWAAAVATSAQTPQADDAVSIEVPVRHWHIVEVEPGESLCKMIDEHLTESAFRNRIDRITASEERKRATAMINILRERGGFRKLALVPENWREIVANLKKKFPNFLEVLEYVAGALALAEQTDGVLHLDPILLNGSPGCGKTMFAKALATEFRSGLLQLNMENAQSNSALSGVAEYWGNTKPGELFNLLVEKDHANPVVFIDEIDKARTREYDPLSSLLSLLEVGTARTFRDLSIPWVTLDASRVIWICTANNADLLSAPILDRLRRFDVPELTKQQSHAIALDIYQELRRGVLGTAPASRLPASSVELLAGMSPRRMRQVLKEGIGRAMLRRSRTVRPSDLMFGRQGTGDKLARMGFLP